MAGVWLQKPLNSAHARSTRGFAESPDALAGKRFSSRREGYARFDRIADGVVTERIETGQARHRDTAPMSMRRALRVKLEIELRIKTSALIGNPEQNRVPTALNPNRGVFKRTLGGP